MPDLYARRYENGKVPLVLRYLPEHYQHAVVRIRPGAFEEIWRSMEAVKKDGAPTSAFS